MFFDSRGFNGSPYAYDQSEATAAPVTMALAAPVATAVPQHMQPLHFATDYRPKCASNIPPEMQATTRQWLTKHADEVISLSRKRHEKRLIDLKNEPFSPVEGPGYEYILACNADKCILEKSGVPGGIGVYSPTKVPVLPNTWNNAYLVRNIPIAVEPFASQPREEGGRNTRRG